MRLRESAAPDNGRRDTSGSASWIVHVVPCFLEIADLQRRTTGMRTIVGTQQCHPFRWTVQVAPRAHQRYDATVGMPPLLVTMRQRGASASYEHTIVCKKRRASHVGRANGGTLQAGRCLLVRRLAGRVRPALRAA